MLEQKSLVEHISRNIYFDWLATEACATIVIRSQRWIGLEKKNSRTDRFWKIARQQVMNFVETRTAGLAKWIRSSKHDARFSPVSSIVMAI